MNRRKRIAGRQSPTLTLVGGGGGERASALSPYGIQRVDSTTSQRISREVRLTELLNYLEREVTTLESKYLEALDIFLRDILPPAVRLLSTSDTTIIEKESTREL